MCFDWKKWCLGYLSLQLLSLRNGHGCIKWLLFFFCL